MRAMDWDKAVRTAAQRMAPEDPAITEDDIYQEMYVYLLSARGARLVELAERARNPRRYMTESLRRFMFKKLGDEHGRV